MPTYSSPGATQKPSPDSQTVERRPPQDITASATFVTSMMPRNPVAISESVQVQFSVQKDPTPTSRTSFLRRQNPRNRTRRLPRTLEHWKLKNSLPGSACLATESFTPDGRAVRFRFSLPGCGIVDAEYPFVPLTGLRHLRPVAHRGPGPQPRSCGRCTLGRYVELNPADARRLRIPWPAGHRTVPTGRRGRQRLHAHLSRGQVFLPMQLRWHQPPDPRELDPHSPPAQLQEHCAVTVELDSGCPKTQRVPLSEPQLRGQKARPRHHLVSFRSVAAGGARGGE